jgi:hypothetical protein
VEVRRHIIGPNSGQRADVANKNEGQQQLLSFSRDWLLR